MHCAPVRILKVVATFHFGGTERQVLNLAQGINPSQFDLGFACLRRSGELLNEIEQRWAPVEFPVASFLQPAAWRQQWRFARYLKSKEIEIVHSYGFYANLFTLPAARLAGTRLVLASIRDRGDYLSRPQKTAQRLACQWAHRVLANSDAVRQKLIEDGYDLRKIVVIRNGITLSKFHQQSGRVLLRRSFDIPDHAPVVAVVARLSRIKGLDHFLQAARVIADRVPAVRFLVVGDGECRQELQRSAMQLGLEKSMIFTGFRRDIPEVLSEVTVSVLPSLSEGLSNTLLESMAAGVPVVSTNVGGNPEAVEDGTTGLLVPPGDPAGLSRAVCTLLENRELAARLGQAGRQRVERLFSIDRMVRQTERLYLELLDSVARWREAA